MVWSERHAQMLQAMGLRQWSMLQPASALTPKTGLTNLAPLAEGFGQSSHQLARKPKGSAPVLRLDSAPNTLDEISLVTNVAALDWPHLREAVARCRACGLCDGRTRTVFGAGQTQAHWMVIGDAPGAQEDAQGEPFVGAAGQLLDQMLRAIGLSRSDDQDPAKSVYITNALKCRPPGNRNPSTDEVAQCRPFLLRQVELLQPRMILAMGRFAVQALLNSTEPIGRLRGRVHSYQRVPTVVTYHPSYLLRNLNEKARAWEDLCLAAANVTVSY